MSLPLIRAARRALEGLRSHGIVASTRACCAACARDEVCVQYDVEPAFLGAACFHAADRVHARRHGVLPISFASGDGVDGEDVRIGGLVAAALEAEGLEVRWDGDPTTRIEACLPEEVAHAH